MTDVRAPAATPEGEAPAEPAGPWWRRWPWQWSWTPGRVGLTVYLVVLVIFSATQGVPLDRIGQTGWILAGIIAARIGKPWRHHLRALVDWLPLLAALVLYDYTRGIADNLDRPVLVGGLADAERWLFSGTMPTVWLQDHLYDPAVVHWWDVAVSIVYFTHFVVPWALAAVFYIRSRQRLWTPYIRRVLMLSYAGLVTYILVPAAPPWYAAYVGEISESVDRIATRGWGPLGLHTADRWLSDAQADVNQVAALPSLHSAFALLVVISLWPFVRHWIGRVLLACFPLAMAFTLVYGGEHYVMDVLAGWSYVAVVVVIATVWERWRARSRIGEPEKPEVVEHA